METKYYIIGTQKGVQEVNGSICTDLRHALPDSGDIIFKTADGRRRGEYTFLLSVNGEFVCSMSNITRYDMACKLKAATGIALHHAERMLKASNEARLIVL